MKGLFGGRNPRAVVFDCDGLLMDTEPCWSVAETELFARRGLPFGADEKALVIGKSLPAAADAMAAAFGEPDAGAEIADELLRLVTEVVTAKAEAMPGSRELVELTAAAVPVAVASNSPRALLDAALVRGDLAGMFPVKLAADEVTAPKPDPEMYLTACALLNVEPADALAFEDSETGLRSARAAGVPVIGVPTLKHQDFPADVVIGSLRDEELLSWVRGWSRR
ncbi:HAD family phosphatase [Amycolatopsis sp. TNS106]|uniref:HAD family hydrolase n=1 Tax=Amycolatopsis sp. TNS106 TaxID=2861750 RepID=UPI001C55BCEF|nr:HAD family phosphatase [Amycolatopsis sp. TNS106]QXV60645.1 HAD family phosphatase [Amycolatopsis sp. TNS106]